MHAAVKDRCVPRSGYHFKPLGFRLAKGRSDISQQERGREKMRRNTSCGFEMLNTSLLPSAELKNYLNEKKSTL